MWKFVAVVLVGSVAFFGADIRANASDEPTRIKIGSPELRENGCSETTQAYKIAIPNPEKVDRSYAGVLSGIEAVENHANNGHWFGGFQYVDDGKAVVFLMRAKGAGNRINSPFGGGSWCAGAEGATEAVDVYVHYKG